jgi:hypothetical protein
MDTIYDTRLNYTVGGAIWAFDMPFTQLPVVTIGIQLNNLSDSIYPISHKIVSLTTTSVTIKVYKVELTDLRDLLFSECATNDVIVHITAEGA